MVFNYFKHTVKRIYGIPIIEVRYIMDTINDFILIQQRYNYLLILNRLFDIRDIRNEILTYLISPNNLKLKRINKYL